MGHPSQPYLESTNVLSDYYYYYYYEQSYENAWFLRAHIFKTTWPIFFIFDSQYLDPIETLCYQFQSSSSAYFRVAKERSLYYVNGASEPTLLREY